MSANVFSMGGDAHQVVQSLLPWYVSGRLDRAEVEVVEGHMSGCARCQAELAWERRLLAEKAAPSDSVVGDVDRGWALLRRQIESTGRAAAPSSTHPSPPRRERARKGVPWWRWLLGAQFAAIVALVALLIRPLAPSEAYHALGAASHAAAGNVVVRFRPDASERDIRRVLKQAGARLVDGPTVTDAYLLDVPAANQAAVLADLRAQAVIVLAESLDGASTR